MNKRSVFFPEKARAVYVKLSLQEYSEVTAMARSNGTPISTFIRSCVVHELNGTHKRRILRCLENKGYHETGDC